MAVEGAPPGGFWIRFVAYMIDGLIMTAAAAILIGFCVGVVILGGASLDHEGPDAIVVTGIILLIVALIVINWL